ncbi:MAG: hypothetical protein JF619_25345 [Massilia sp.]|nr:hypothetical protein [Massilia sp.]
MLDLNGDGVHTLSIESGVKFDLLATGSPISTGWVDKQDGLLALDRNGNGVIDSGAELFGTSTKLADGSKAQDGYQALAALDANADGKIDSQDAAFANLRVWVDANSDGVSQAGELKSLAELNVKSIGVQAQKLGVKDNGNWVGLGATFETNDGGSRATGDVWFVADKNGQELRDKVSNLAQALSGAAADLSATSINAVTLPSITQGSGSTTLAVAVNVNKLTSLLGQFDANGKPLGSITQLSATSDALKLNGLDPLAPGYLAAPTKS